MEMCAVPGLAAMVTEVAAVYIRLIFSSSKFLAASSVDVAVIVLDHLDGRSHLFRKEIYVDAFHEAEGCIGVPQHPLGFGMIFDRFSRLRLRGGTSLTFHSLDSA
jgi:hypothetical protein